jgi:hypothetical protein
MIHYMFMPLDQHFDSGFGAIGNVFRDAAEKLQKNEDLGPLFNARLPVCYLYRHAIELFLKSGVVIIHRKCETAEQAEQGTMPLVPMGNHKSKRVDRIHSVDALYIHLRALFRTHDIRLKNIDDSPLRWPDGADEAVKLIEKFDSCSDYFRYPASRSAEADLLKSSMKQADLDQLQEKLRTDPSSVHSFVLVDDDGNPVEAFEHENRAIEVLEQNLTCGANFLCELHAAMRALLTDGL